jgi:glyceraldehyde 3-phosphate dehydrogenase
MATTTIGLMGFGRIGRNIFRILYKSDDIRIGAISDPSDPAGLEYLLKFDTILGRFPDEVSIREGNLYVAGRQIPVIAGEAGGTPPWGDLGVDTVVEATARRRTRAELEAHLKAGAKRVLLCAPPQDPPDITIVMGVNDQDLRPEHRIVSNGSCTVHCVAPVLKILSEAFGIERAFLTTVHAYTNQQRLADVPDKDKRRGRAAAENIIPQETNAAAMLMELVPELKGKVTAASMNVPVRNGSVVDLVAWHTRKVTPVAINEVVRTATASSWKGILHYETDPIVSSDVIQNTYSSTFDSLATMVLNERVSKTLAWYDNGFGYAHRAVELVQRFATLGTEASR